MNQEKYHSEDVANQTTYFRIHRASTAKRGSPGDEDDVICCSSFIFLFLNVFERFFLPYQLLSFSFGALQLKYSLTITNLHSEQG